MRMRVACCVALCSALLGPSTVAAEHRAPTCAAYGAVTHVFLGESPNESRRELDLLQRAGATVTRVEVPLPVLFPDSATLDRRAFVRVRQFVTQADARGIAVIAGLGGIPSWLAPPGCRTPANPAIPSNWARFDRLIARVARGLARHVWAFNAWNEPNNPTFYTGTPTQFSKVQQHTYHAIKRVVPRALVVAGSFALADAGYVHSLYDRGVRDHFDMLGLHPYAVDIQSRPGSVFFDWMRPTWPGGDSSETFERGLAAVRGVMVRHGDRATPIVIDEIGVPTCPAGPTSDCVTESTQAAWLQSYYRLASQLPFVRAVLVYRLRDVPSDDTEYGGFGLVRTDFTPKLAYRVLAQVWHSNAGECPR